MLKEAEPLVVTCGQLLYAALELIDVPEQCNATED
jgi:hypothetical protein